MQFWLSEQARLSALILLCALLWTLESAVPLYRYGKNRLPRAAPNVILALLLVLTNLALSAVTAGLADFTDSHGIGLLHLLDWQLAAVVVFGLPMWVVAVYLTLSGLNAQLEHANIRLSERADGLPRLFVVTPNMHKAHHSRLQKETDTNYSNIFSFWDRLCGTYTPRVDFNKLRYGLDGFDDAGRQSLRGLLRMPFMRF